MKQMDDEMLDAPHHAHACACGECASEHDEALAHTACDCGEDDCCCGEEEYDLRYVSETQIACSGADLIELLNFDADVDEALYQRLGLTASLQREEDFEYYDFAEIDLERYYMLTFPPETDFSNFTVAHAIALEEISAQRFEELALDDSEMACNGDCETCDQDCIGKQPVV